MLLAFIATCAVFVVLTIAGAIAARRVQSLRARHISVAVGVLTAVPCIAFAAYYLHLWDEPLLLYRFRALPGSELAAGLSGWLAGWCGWTLVTQRQRLMRLSTALIVVFPVLLQIPYAKPWLAPLQQEEWHERWSAGVCLQTTPSTCGPSCAATLLRQHGRDVSERTLAEAAHTTAGGTECWYLVRALRALGMNVTLVATDPNPHALPWPSIAGTRLGEGGSGHYVTVLGEDEHSYIIGDPLRGRVSLPRADIGKTRWFTGFFMRVDTAQR